MPQSFHAFFFRLSIFHIHRVCENNCVRKIARVTRADTRRIVELREETGVQMSLTEEETWEAKAEMGGLCKEGCEEGRRGGRLEEEDKR